MKISKRRKRGWKLILVSQHDHVVALLSGWPLIAIWLSMSSYVIVMTKMLLFLFWLLRVSLFSPRIFNIFFIKLRGCS